MTSACFINSLRFSGGGGAGRVKLTSDSVVSELRSREPTSIVAYTRDLGSPSGESVTSGDITFNVQFSPWVFSFWRFTERRRFEGRIAEDGKLKWYHKAVNE